MPADSGNSAAGVSTLSEASNSSSGGQDNEVFIDTSKFYTCTVTSLLFMSIILSLMGNCFETAQQHNRQYSLSILIGRGLPCKQHAIAYNS